MNTSDRIMRLWEKVPETRVANIEYGGGSWNIHGGDLTEQQAHDLAGAEIERWLATRNVYGVEVESGHKEGLWVCTIYGQEGRWYNSTRFIAPTKIEALLSAAERVAGLETT